MVELVVEVIRRRLAVAAVQLGNNADDWFGVAAESPVLSGDDPDVIHQQPGNAVADDGREDGPPDRPPERFAWQEHLLEIEAVDGQRAHIQRQGIGR